MPGCRASSADRLSWLSSACNFSERLAILATFAVFGSCSCICSTAATRSAPLCTEVLSSCRLQLASNGTATKADTDGHQVSPKRSRTRPSGHAHVSPPSESPTLWTGRDRDVTRHRRPPEPLAPQAGIRHRAVRIASPHRTAWSLSPSSAACGCGRTQPAAASTIVPRAVRARRPITTAISTPARLNPAITHDVAASPDASASAAESPRRRFGGDAAVDGRGHRRRDGGADVPGHVRDAGRCAHLLRDRCGRGRRRGTVGQPHADGDGDQRQEEGGRPRRSTNPTTAKPMAVTRKPRPTTSRPPILAANLGTSGATTTRPTVAGRVASPASRGLKSSVLGSWKYRLSTYISALMVPAPIRIATVDPTSTRLRSSARSRSGSARGAPPPRTRTRRPRPRRGSRSSRPTPSPSRCPCSGPG